MKADNSAPGIKLVSKAAIILMSGHAPDFGMESCALWFSYAGGEATVVAALKPYVDDGRRMTDAERDDHYLQLLAPDSDTREAAVLSHVNESIERIEKTVDLSRDSAVELLEQLEQFTTSLTEPERLQFGERLNDLTATGHALQFQLGKSGTLLADTKVELPEFCIELDAEDVPDAEPKIAVGTVVSCTTILSGLHHLCSRDTKGRQAGSLLVEIDALARIAKVLTPSKLTDFVDDVARRVAGVIGDAGDVGHYEDRRILVLIEPNGSQSAEALAEACVEIFVDRPVGNSLDVPRQISVSVGVTSLTEEDIPEAVIGRLSRAVQRVAMRGGNNAEFLS